MDHRKQTWHKAYYKYKSITKSKVIGRKTEIRVHRVTIRPVATYETDNIRIIKRETVRRIYIKNIRKKILNVKKFSDTEHPARGRHFENHIGLEITIVHAYKQDE